MKKTILTLAAIAVLGAIGIADKIYSPKHQLVAPSSTSAAGSNMAATAQNGIVAPSTAAPYRDGSFTGSSNSDPYGPVEIKVVVSGGKITGVNFLQMPNADGHTREVTAFSEPLLKQSTIAHQSAQIDYVSGATDTSLAYQESLQAALDQAKI